MINKRIKYFSYRGCESPAKLRKNSPAADSKIDYIISVLNRCGYSVDHISRAYSSIPNYIPAYVEQKGDNTFRYFASLGMTNSLFRIFNRWFMDFQFLIWCFMNIKQNEKIIVYHSLGYSSIFVWLKKMKNIKVLGEIEEIYQDVHPQSPSKRKAEYSFIDNCDKYLFASDLLNRKLNKYKKPYSIIHGLYKIEDKLEKKNSDGKIHVVYGGTLDPQKGGAFAAASAAEYLSEDFHVHICGFGDSIEIQKQIASINARSQATLTFEGELNGDDYKHFIQKCHIGLSTQNPTGIYNDTSFPSKILVYLSNGLKVVTIRIPVVEQSSVSQSVVYYNNQTPEDIAAAIQKAVIVNVNGREILEELDRKFEKELALLVR